MYGIYANIWGILMVNVTIYGIHGSYGIWIIYEWIDSYDLGYRLGRFDETIGYWTVTCWLSHELLEFFFDSPEILLYDINWDSYWMMIHEVISFTLSKIGTGVDVDP